MTSAPGWYADPQFPAVLRWWDGTQWTDRTQQAATPPPLHPPSPPTPPTPPTPPAPAQGGPPAAQPGSPWALSAPAPDQMVIFPTVDGRGGRGARRGRRSRWIGAGVAVLLVAGATTAVVLSVQAIRHTAAPATQAAGYLHDLSRGEYGSAYERLCVLDKRTVGLAQFTRSKAAHHPLTYSVSSTTESTVNGIRTAKVDYGETTSDDEPDTTVLTLEDSAQGWRVCHRGISPTLWAGAPTSSPAASPALPAALRLPSPSVGATALVSSD